MIGAQEGLEREAQRRASGRGRLVALLLTALPFVATVIAIALASKELKVARAQMKEARSELEAVEKRLGAAQDELAAKKGQLAVEKKELTATRTELGHVKRSTESLLAFLKTTADEEHLPFLDDRVEWKATVDKLLSEPSSSRRSAAFSAILAAWRKTPFVFNGKSLSTGIDSPRFATVMMKKAGVENLPEDSDWKPGDLRLSDKLKERFPEVAKPPRPGDLVFAWVSKASGRYVSMYLGNDACVGIDGSNRGFQIVPCKKYLKEKGWSFEGYRRVDYPG